MEDSGGWPEQAVKVLSMASIPLQCGMDPENPKRAGIPELPTPGVTVPETAALLFTELCEVNIPPITELCPPNGH